MLLNLFDCIKLLCLSAECLRKAANNQIPFLTYAQLYLLIPRYEVCSAKQWCIQRQDRGQTPPRASKSMGALFPGEKNDKKKKKKKKNN